MFVPPAWLARPMSAIRSATVAAVKRAGRVRSSSASRRGRNRAGSWRLVRSDRHCVYGIICEATHAELRSLYGQDWLGGTYLPEPVLVEIADGRLVPALCYIAPTRPPARPADDYLDWIIGPAREYGFPDWYIERLEHFRKQP